MRRPRRGQRHSPRYPRWTLFAGAVIVVFLLQLLRRQAESAEVPFSLPRSLSRGIQNAAIGMNPHVALGLPTDADPSDDILLDQREYVLSYDAARNDPNWASWRLEQAHLGIVHRRHDFRSDPKLPFGVYQVTPDDYAHSGYDRGHLCPSADRTRDAEQNALTFLMTNVQPQLHELNAGPWESLEKYERELAKPPDTELYIVAGGIFDVRPPTIGRGVAVPRAAYKVIVALKKGQKAADITATTPIVAVILPNSPGVGKRAWTDYLVSVDDVERESGYDLLGNIPLPVQAQIEAVVARPH